MSKRREVIGYNYSNARQAAFDGVIGRLPALRWPELPVAGHLLLTAVIVSRNPVRYTWNDGTLKQSLPATVCSIIGGPRNPNWPTAALSMELIEYTGAIRGRRREVRFLPENEDLRSVLQDLDLYYQKPDALMPEEWAMIHRKAEEVCHDPQINHSGALAAALGYVLLAQADACQP